MNNISNAINDLYLSKPSNVLMASTSYTIIISTIIVFRSPHKIYRISL